MPGVSYITTTPLAQVIGEQTRSWRLGASMFSAFGLLALVLAAIGLYSVIAYNVAQRTHELGVRMALGAQRADLLRLVVIEGLRLGVAGVVIGGAIAFAASRWLAPLLFNESARDPAVYAVVGLVGMVEGGSNSSLLRRIASIRKQLATELGYMLPAVRVTDNYFSVTGTPVALGRPMQTGETDRASCPGRTLSMCPVTRRPPISFACSMRLLANVLAALDVFAINFLRSRKSCQPRIQ